MYHSRKGSLIVNYTVHLNEVITNKSDLIMLSKNLETAAYTWEEDVLGKEVNVNETRLKNRNTSQYIHELYKYTKVLEEIA
jgi:cell division protein FtsL